MFRNYSKKCECWVTKFCIHEVSSRPGICTECSVYKKYANPIRMLMRALMRKDISILSDREIFEIGISGVLKTTCTNDPLQQKLVRVYGKKFGRNCGLNSFRK